MSTDVRQRRALTAQTYQQLGTVAVKCSTNISLIVPSKTNKGPRYASSRALETDESESLQISQCS